MKKWNSEDFDDADALSWFASDYRKDFAFRTRLFDGLPYHVEKDPT